MTGPAAGALRGAFEGARTVARCAGGRAVGALAARLPPRGEELAFLGLGSNLGERLDHLQRGVDLLGADPAIVVEDVSTTYETAPVGGPPQDPYLNCAVRVRTTLAPRPLLQRCLAVEARLHRVRRERWGPRTLDVDVLLYGHRVVDAPDLVVPHPRLRERAFAAVPLLEVAPGWSLPDGSSLASVVAALAPIEGIAPIGRHVVPPPPASA